MKFGVLITAILALFSQSSFAISGETYFGKTEDGKHCEIGVSMDSSVTHMAWFEDDDVVMCAFENKTFETKFVSKEELQLRIGGLDRFDNVCKALVRIDEKTRKPFEAKLGKGRLMQIGYDVTCKDLIRIGGF